MSKHFFADIITLEWIVELMIFFLFLLEIEDQGEF